MCARSAMAPETIVLAVAQKLRWKKKAAHVYASSMPDAKKSPDGPTPINGEPSPNAMCTPLPTTRGR